VPDTPNLHPTPRDELTQSLTFALRFNGRKRVHDADEAMAQITTDVQAAAGAAWGSRGPRRMD